MVANDNAGCLTPLGVSKFIASMLAPTEMHQLDGTTIDSSSAILIECVVFWCNSPLQND
jgi:hypothetical protein